MDIVLYVLILFVLLMEIFFMQGNVVAMIVATIVSIFYLVFRIFIKKKLAPLPGAFSCFGILAVLAGCIFLMGVEGTAGGFISYEAKMETVCTYLQKGDYDKAAKQIEKMEEEYGETDTTHMLAALSMLSVGQTEEAYEEYLAVSDKNSMVSIILAEQIYKADTTGAYVDKLYELYSSAAERYPEWEYIQLCTGVIKIDYKEYEAAQYYLYNAYAANPENPQTLFFLGLSSYKLGNREDTLYFFNRAIECGADDTQKSYIKGYLDEMGYWDKESAE